MINTIGLQLDKLDISKCKLSTKQPNIQGGQLKFKGYFPYFVNGDQIFVTSLFWNSHDNILQFTKDIRGCFLSTEIPKWDGFQNG